MLCLRTGDTGTQKGAIQMNAYAVLMAYDHINQLHFEASQHRALRSEHRSIVQRIASMAGALRSTFSISRLEGHPNRG